MAFSAQAQTTNICDRTQQVVDEILRLTSTKNDTCDSVLVSEMAGIQHFALITRGIMSLNPGDFGGLIGVRTMLLNGNDFTELRGGVFSDLTSLRTLFLEQTSLSILHSDTFSNLQTLMHLNLAESQLEELPAGFFSELTHVPNINLRNNPGAPFQLTVKFEPETLEENFTAAPIRLVLREGALTTITAPLSITGSGGELIPGSPDALTIAAGSTQSDTVTVIRGKGYFRLTQGDLELGNFRSGYQGFEIVRGLPLTFGGIQVRARVFLEGALE